ncbi:MAG: 3-phosphoshikimate 1-carboxyvinyltransferase [Rhodobacterales bacterium]|nr:3-phosphoshikimate 1-carboxyvinyltransferase [Rhodobacterales bacterium]
MRLTAHHCQALTGDIPVPGDKSISHRALMLGALAVGETRITGLLEGEDVLRTAAAMEALGATVTRDGPGAWRVSGRGVSGLREPDDVLDMGNSGTGARLLMGLLAGHPFTTVLTGDGSLRSRPMARVTTPLAAMGATFVGRSGGRMPLAVTGAADLLPLEYVLPVASAQVKSAVLLAGLHAPGETRVIEPEPTRDHTELMLRHFGAQVRVEDRPDGTRLVAVTGQPELTARDVVVPGDVSSAAFPLAAALTVPGSAVTLRTIGLNPLRAGLIDTLRDMGADITIANPRTEAGEPVGDLVVRAGPLMGVDVPPGRAPRMIDEYPVLAAVAASARGTTRMTGLGELRVKESDRLAAMARGLAACGVAVEETADSLTVHGTGGTAAPAGGAVVDAELDHRIAMSFLVLGLAAAAPVSVTGADAIATSFPGFTDLMGGLGARIAADDTRD